MKHTFKQKIKCKEPINQCSEDIIKQLENKLGIKLMARIENDIVNGFVNIHHEKNEHTITVVTYDEDEKPKDKLHKTTFKKPNITKAKLESVK